MRIDQRRDRLHARGEALAGEGVGHHHRALPHLQLFQKALVGLRDQLRRTRERQRQQCAAGLHDLPRLDQPRQHLGIGRRGQHGLIEARTRRRCGGGGQAQLRLRLQRLGALITSGRALRLRAGLLRSRDGNRALHFIEARWAEKALRHQLARALQLGQRGGQHRIGLRERSLRTAAPGAAQAGQPRRGLALGGLRLHQRGLQLIAFETQQHLALFNLCAFGDGHLQHAAGERRAHIDARRRGHARGELQRAHER